MMSVNSHKWQTPQDKIGAGENGCMDAVEIHLTLMNSRWESEGRREEKEDDINIG